MPARVDSAGAALVIHAAARAGTAADLTRLHGASATWIVAPNGTWQLVDDDIVPARPGARPAPTIVPTAGIASLPDETPDI
jgi:hypothetical protein